MLIVFLLSHSLQLFCVNTESHSGHGQIRLLQTGWPYWNEIHKRFTYVTYQLLFLCSNIFFSVLRMFTLFIVRISDILYEMQVSLFSWLIIILSISYPHSYLDLPIVDLGKSAWPHAIQVLTSNILHFLLNLDSLCYVITILFL